MSAIPIIKQGEDLDFSFDLGGDDITGWVCDMSVKTSVESQLLLIDRMIAPDGNAWPGSLTSEETALLGTGLHLLIAKLTNDGTDQKRQIDKRFMVQAALHVLPPQTFFILIEGTKDRILIEGTQDKILQEINVG